MNSCTTNPCTLVRSTTATLNGTLVSKDAPLANYGFIGILGTTGDPVANQEGLLVWGIEGGDLAVGDYTFNATDFAPDTDYRIRFACAILGEETIYFYGSTVDLHTSPTPKKVMVKL